MCDTNIRRHFQSFFKIRTNIIWLFLFSISMLITIFVLSQGQSATKKGHRKISLRKPPPVLVTVMGGIGNQLFQYAAAFSIAKKRNSDIHICAKLHINSKSVDPAHYTAQKRLYVLDQFNVPQDTLLYISEHVTCSSNYYSNWKKVDTFKVDERKALTGDLPDDKVLLITDYFESEVFFASDKADILDTFIPIFDTQPIADLIKLVLATKNSVSVHIRRGDFAIQSDCRIMPIGYQMEAIQVVKEKLNTDNVTFFVFTDDLNYVKSHLEKGNAERSNIIYMSEFTKDNSLYDFLLMTLCLHNIITNSTFSWWAAYLNKNPNKIVVAPMPKHNPEKVEKSYRRFPHKMLLIGELAYPKDWFTIKPTFFNCSDDL